MADLHVAMGQLRDRRQSMKLRACWAVSERFRLPLLDLPLPAVSFMGAIRGRWSWNWPPFSGITYISESSR